MYFIVHVSPVTLQTFSLRQTFQLMFTSELIRVLIYICPLDIVTSVTCHTLLINIPDLVTRLQQRAHGYLSAVAIPCCPRMAETSEVLVQTYRGWVGMVAGKSAPHFSVSMPAEARYALIRLRLSCSPLVVNSGRFRRIPRIQRTCPVCVAQPSFALAHPHFPIGHVPPCEDIRHFILECPLYDLIRRDTLFSPLFAHLPFIGPLPAPSECIQAIFSTPRQELLARCVHCMFQLRSDILNGNIAWGTPHSLLPPPGHVFHCSCFSSDIQDVLPARYFPAYVHHYRYFV